MTYNPEPSEPHRPNYDSEEEYEAAMVAYRDDWAYWWRSEGMFSRPEPDTYTGPSSLSEGGSP